MLFKGIEICCPNCKGDLAAQDNGQEVLHCQKCPQEFPIIVGIPDLRIFSDPYISIKDDRKKGLSLADRLDDLSFSELVEYYYRTTSVVPAHHAKQYIRGLMGAVGRAEAGLQMWEQCTDKANEKQSCCMLEVGCGTAPLLVAAAQKYQKVVGVDIAFRWLIVGKKRLMEAGLDLPLICACAEALPFPEQWFDRVVAESTIEHVQEQDQTFNECQRVLKPRGYFFISTPNRLSLGPDPQTGIWAGGWLSERWTASHVRRQGGIPPKRRLLSFWSLQSCLERAGFIILKISLPDIPEGQREQFGRMTKGVIDLYHMAKRFPLSRELLYLFGPLFHAICQKSSHKSSF
jgi:ubiquinone/menaquinone biosynthesis C-methylase UbiE/uncharacterized protein YbaR (Trm112 family)